jgi:hypothetical protein
MATPLVKAAWRHVMDSPVPARLIFDGLLGRDPYNGAYPDGWVFSGDLSGDPYRPVEGTGMCAVVIYTYDHWSPGSDRHTLLFPRLQIAIYADDSRDDNGNPTRHDAEERCVTVYRALRPLFHDAGNQVRQFGTMRVISTLESQSLSLMAIPNGDGAVRGVAAFDVTLD